MITIASLWLPILLSAVIVFAASSIIWMLMPWHRGDWRALPNEEAARAGLKGTPPGQYQVPFCSSHKAMKDPEFQRKANEGPVAFIVVRPNGMSGMGKSMVVWFIFCLLVSTVLAYVASRTLPPGTPYLEVFRIVGTVGWLAYGAASVADAVWFGRSWRMVAGLQFDALIYGLLTAGVFGWQWPHA